MSDGETPADDRSEEERIAEAFAQLTKQCEGLLRAWDAVYPQLGAGAKPGSPADQEATAFRNAHPDAAKNVEHGAGQFAGSYLSAQIQYLRGLMALLNGQATTLSAWLVVRALLENAGRITWLLEPSVAADKRVARSLMEELIAHCRTDFTASKRKKKDQEKDAKKERDRCRKSIDGLFPGAAYDWSAPGSEATWVVNGENFLGLGETNALFLRLATPTARGVYDYLSDFSHPSVVSLHRQTKLVDDAGVSEVMYVLPMMIISWQVLLAWRQLVQVRAEDRGTLRHRPSGFAGLGGLDRLVRQRR